VPLSAYVKKGFLAAFGFSPGWNNAFSFIRFLKPQDVGLAATSGGDPAPTRARQYVLTSVIVPPHQHGLKGCLTKHHGSGVMDVSGRYVAMLINLLQSLDQSLFVRVCHPPDR